MFKSIIVKMTAEIKKNKELSNVAPGTYESTMKTKKQEP